jgi:hypothetical protein
MFWRRRARCFAESPDGVALSANGRRVPIMSDGRVHAYDAGD